MTADRLKSAALWVAASCYACTLPTPSDAFAPELSFGAPTQTFGSVDGPGLVFGSIADLELRRDGTLLVLDPSAKRVLHLSSEGELLATFGREGDGPGEFQSPVDIALLPGDDYAVLDRDRLRVTRVRIEAGVHRHVGDVALQTPALRLCSVGEDLVVNGVDGSHALVRIDPSGAVVGEYYALPDVVDPAFPEHLQRELRDLLRLGAMECFDSGDVLFASEWSSRVVLFGPGGEVLQSTDASPHVPLQYRVSETGSAIPDLPPEGWVHRTLTVHQIEPGVVLTQFMRFGPSAGGPDDPPTGVRVIRLADGAQVVLPDTLPILESIERGVAWGWRNLPFPQVVQLPVVFSGS